MGRKHTKIFFERPKGLCCFSVAGMTNNPCRVKLLGEPVESVLEVGGTKRRDGDATAGTSEPFAQATTDITDNAQVRASRTDYLTGQLGHPHTYQSRVDPHRQRRKIITPTTTMILTVSDTAIITPHPPSRQSVL